MISIEYGHIPQWLRAGEFYRSLSPDNLKDPEDHEPNVIHIPDDCFAETNQNQQDLARLVKTTLFWMLDEIPIGIVEFCTRNEYHIWQKTISSIPNVTESRMFDQLLKGSSQDENVPLEIVIKTGSLKLILFAARRMCDPGRATEIAVEVGDLRILKYLHEQGYPLHKNTSYAASRSGKLACLRYAHEHGCPWDKKATLYAAEKGYLECLRYLLQQGCPIHSDACNATSKGGHLSCLKLLDTFKAPWCYITTHYAAMCADVSCLQYLHEHGCPWDKYTPMHAARAGHTHTLRYALEHSCPCDRDSLLFFAAQSGNLECLQYLVDEQGLPMNKKVFETAMVRGNLQCLQYLMYKGCPSMYAVNTTLIEEYLDGIFVKNNPEFTQCVRYAVERGWKADAAFCKYVSSRDAECTAYLRSEGLFVEDTAMTDTVHSAVIVRREEVAVDPVVAAAAPAVVVVRKKRNVCIVC